MRNENQMVPKAVRSLPIASSIIARLTFDDVDQVPDVQSWEQPEALEPNGQVYRAGMRLKLHAFAVSTLQQHKVLSPIFFFRPNCYQTESPFHHPTPENTSQSPPNPSQSPPIPLSPAPSTSSSSLPRASADDDDADDDDDDSPPTTTRITTPSPPSPTPSSTHTLLSTPTSHRPRGPTSKFFPWFCAVGRVFRDCRAGGHV